MTIEVDLFGNRCPHMATLLWRVAVTFTLQIDLNISKYIETMIMLHDCYNDSEHANKVFMEH